MAPLVPLVQADPMTQGVGGGGSRTCGHEGALARTNAVQEPSNERVRVIVADGASDMANRLAFIRAVREAVPSLAIISMARMPSKLADEGGRRFVPSHALPPAPARTPHPLGCR